MNRAGLLILLTSVLCAVSCTKVDVQYPQGRNISFTYVPGEGAPSLRFSYYIASVSYFIYDSSGKLYTQGIVQTGGEDDFAPGIRLELPEGKYRIVCWGNLEHFNRAEESMDLSSARITNTGEGSVEGVSSSDPLYYASADFTQQRQADAQNLELSFSNVHIPIWVYIRGFIDEKIPGYEQPPQIELTAFPTAFNFEGKPADEAETYYPQPTYDASKNQISARSLVPRFDEQTTAVLNIYSGDDDHRLLYSLSLKDYMADNDIHIDDKQEVSLPILVEFYHNGLSLSVSVRKPDWKEVEVSPVW